MAYGTSPFAEHSDLDDAALHGAALHRATLHGTTLHGEMARRAHAGDGARLSWPVATLVIGGLSAGLWFGIIRLAGALF